MSPLLSHLLDCRDASDEPERGGSGDEVLWADGRAAEGPAEQHYRDIGIISRWRATDIQNRELRADPGLSLFNGRRREHIINRLKMRDLIPDEDE
jgi:hypothetical protein